MTTEVSFSYTITCDRCLAVIDEGFVDDAWPPSRPEESAHTCEEETK